MSPASKRLRHDTIDEYQFKFMLLFITVARVIKCCYSDVVIKLLPYPPLDNIQVMVIVWRLRGNIIRTAPCWVV